MEKKLKYESPIITVVEIELEQGIAAASSSIRTGTVSDNDTPMVEDWKVGDSFVDDFNM